VTAPEAGSRQCALSGLTPEAGRLSASGIVLEAGITGPVDLLFFLVTADNGAGTEGTLGAASAAERTADGYCSR
jgi:hypothetical protein